MSNHIHFLGPLNSNQIQILVSRLHPELIFTHGEIPEDPRQVSILIGGSPNPEHFTTFPNVQALILPSSGVPASTANLMRGYPQIKVFNMSHHAPIVAEMALTLALAVARNILPCDRAMRENDWSIRYEPTMSTSLTGKTALILGYGNIGQHIARLCQPFGMQINAIKRTTNPGISPAEDVTIFTQDALGKLLLSTDVLFNALPLTPETSLMMGSDEFALLPEGGIVVNVGRAQTIDEEALYLALKSNHLRGAGLDVWYRSPKDVQGRSSTPPSQFPFNELPNVVMSPHCGSAYYQREDQHIVAFAELINRYVDNPSRPTPVDLSRGY